MKDNEKVSVGEVRQNDLVFRMNASSRKFFENALWASSSRNGRERGAESEDEEAPKRKGFWIGVDLCLSAIDTTNVNRI